jgi:hypothetical protein
MIFPRPLQQFLGLKVLKFSAADPGSGAFLTLYPEGKGGIEKFGSRIWG